jgi:hypothetical protein
VTEGCQAELVEGCPPELGSVFRQAQHDNKLNMTEGCQPELVEGGFCMSFTIQSHNKLL